MTRCWAFQVHCRTLLASKTVRSEMFRANRSFVSLLLLLTSPQELQSADMCRRVHEGKLRMQVLTGHVISTQTTYGIEECADLCDKDPPCYSVNYYEKQRKCELNDKTSFNHPEHMIRHADGSYLDIHRPYSDCSDYFCDVRQVCKMDRVDRTYCKVCDAPLGMESGEIKDSQVTASSCISERKMHQPSSARLHSQIGHWRPEKGSVVQWLQIDFIDRVAVTKVATQGISPAGSSEQRWVESYKLSFSEGIASSWKYFKETGQEKVFSGNRDSSTVVTHALSPKIRHTRFVRFVVMTWKGAISMRVEVYGCRE